MSKASDPCIKFQAIGKDVLHLFGSDGGEIRVLCTLGDDNYCLALANLTMLADLET
jgi:hypothetical protein